MLITFTGDPRARDRSFIRGNRGFSASDPEHVDMYGMRFPLGEPVSVPDDSEWARQWGGKIRGNSHFEVSAKSAGGMAPETVALSAEPTIATPLTPLSNVDDTDDERKHADADALTIERLRADATGLGVKVDARWSETTLRKKIDDALAADGK